MIGALATLALQIGALTTPAGGDTLGYWQQRVRYEIVARLDEQTGVAHARATLTYTNNSPDTLREMFVHQYLNAFRPGSKWSAVDERENRTRFQRLRDPDYGYERFTAPLGVASARQETAPIDAEVDYPGSPDSTVAHFALPEPLHPGDSIRLVFAWDARPSTVFRRQGRRGRVFDFAQWYPKVAVYDRGGWEPNALVPAGELYGEFGTYDVTLLVPQDQVVGATGVPVSGDPGWAKATRWGAVWETTHAYGTRILSTPLDSIPAGYKAVRFLARDVHHFAWSVNPDFRYEGGVYVRSHADRTPHFPIWDTVAVHVLYRPGDEREWGNGVAVRRTQAALAWLESIYGPYAYPQLTNLHRLDGGGTEFPMMMQNGSASQGLILHEGGHMFTYALLANNEWRSAWMDEGLTSYQTSWAEGTTPQDRGVREAGDPRSTAPAELSLRSPGAGYARHRIAPDAIDRVQIGQYRLELTGRAEALGKRSDLFREFGIYNEMVYTRAELMYGQLRDALGESAFRRFMHGYYDRWALKHVDERAMRAEAERAHGKDLGWFFDQWLRQTGLIDYAIGAVDVHADGETWLTRARVIKIGEYRHPMPVGARTVAGWTVVRADPLLAEQVVEIRTTQRPFEVRLDPFRTTEDWNRRNDVSALAIPGLPLDARLTQARFDWPFVDMVARDQTVARIAPLAWYGDSTGPVFAVRARTSYLGDVDRWEYGMALATRLPRGVSRLGRFAGWVTFENPTLPWSVRPSEGLRGAAYAVDGIALADVQRTWDTSPFFIARGPRSQVSLGVLATKVVIAPLVGSDPFRATWERSGFVEGRLGSRVRTVADIDASLLAGGGTRFGEGGPASSPFPTNVPRTFYWARGEVKRRTLAWNGQAEASVRGFGSYSSEGTPDQRRPGLSADDAIATFGNDWYRPTGALLKRRNVNFQPLGGAGLRGYQPLTIGGRFAAVNGELGVRATTFGPGERSLGLWLTAFGDAGSTFAAGDEAAADAGLGVAIRGRLYDRAVRLRVDVPLYVRQPPLGVGEYSGGSAESRQLKLRYAFSFSELW
ncbi:MAG: M1 family metallopeptidase [Gemmatimonadaceae bacterium]